MGLFTFRKEKEVQLKTRTEQDGYYLSVWKDDHSMEIPLTFSPKELKQLDRLDTFILLEDLWYDNRLKRSENEYLLDYETVYLLEAGERKLLDLPEEETELSIEVSNKSFIGSSKFRMIPEFHTADHPRLSKNGKRFGPLVITSDGNQMLINKKQFDFLNLVEKTPRGDDYDALFYHIAQVKKEAGIVGATLDVHLRGEDYEFVEELSLDVEKDHNGLRLKTQYQHSDLDETVLEDPLLKKMGTLKKNNRRIFIEKSVKQNSRKIDEIGPIEGQDVPGFVQNPEAYIPDDIPFSKEAFGERVKNLGIKVYKASPYIHANSTDNGWFDFRSGFHVQDDEGNSITEEADSFFDDNEGDSFKKVDEDTYVAVPHEAQEFKQYTKKLKQEKDSPNSKKYILEIFENLHNVEFNQPLYEMRESLKTENVFEKRPPSLFKANLHPFQEDGFIWMKSLRFSGYGGLLADDMGLGKTIQVIAYLSYLKEQEKLTPTLLVLPKTLIDNWINEIQKFAPELAKNCYVHLTQKRTKDPNFIMKHDLVLTTYQTLASDQIHLAQVDWQMVIGDEAQQIKNPTTNASIVMKALKNKGRLALTGTPVENNLSELWSIVDFVQPGMLGSLKEFKNRYEKPLKSEKADYGLIQKEIEEKIQFIYKRRTKAGELKDQLPAKYEHHGEHTVPLGKVQEMMYQEVITSVKNKDVAAIDGIRRLKMLCSHPGLIDSGLKDLKPKEVPKLETTIKLLKDIKSKSEKALIFTEYREMQAILKLAIAKTFDLNAMIINGSTNSRQQLVDQFNRNEGFDVLILSPKAAGTGLTITSANHVIHYTRWWNPAVENQATDRAYRIGQTKDVHVYYPLVTDKESGSTVESIIDDILRNKKTLAENVVVPSRDIDMEEVMTRVF